MTKNKVREFIGNTKPDLLEKATVALAPEYPMGVDNDGNEIRGETPSPTSVELLDDYARVWFEYDPAFGDNVEFKWQYSKAIPLFYFWGKKKRDKYLKEQKQLCDERSKQLDERIERIRNDAR